MEAIRQRSLNSTAIIDDIAADTDGGFSISEFCQRYPISVSQTYVEMAEGRLIAKKVGKRTIIPRANARNWFASMPDRKPESQAA